jgi:hypothetical protein
MKATISDRNREREKFTNVGYVNSIRSNLYVYIYIHIIMYSGSR